MMQSPLRALAFGAVALLALGGCATPGNGDPGNAATYRDRVITQADVAQTEATLRSLNSESHPGEALTLLLIGPGAVGIAEDLGVNFTEAGIRADALIWMSATKREQFEPTPDVLELVVQVRALAYILNDADGIAQMIALVTDVQDNTTTSPRYGDFTLEHFSTSIGEIQAFLVDNQAGLSGAAFLAYKDIDGYASETVPEWVSGG